MKNPKRFKRLRVIHTIFVVFLYPALISLFLWGCSTSINSLIEDGETTAALQRIDRAQSAIELQEKDKAGYMPIHRAAHRGYDEVVSALIRKGVSVNAPTDQGYTPLHVAARRGKLSVVQALLRNKAQVNARSPDGETPLKLAVFQDPPDTDVVRLLLANGADANTKDDSSFTPLVALFSVGSKCMLQVGKLLLDNGADVNAKSFRGLTPLHALVVGGETEATLKMLKKVGRQFGERDVQDMIAYVLSKDSLLAEVLLAKGADPNAKDNRGSTPLMYAVLAAKRGVARAILARKPNINARNDENHTALGIARRMGVSDLIQLLEEAGAKEE